MNRQEELLFLEKRTRLVKRRNAIRKIILILFTFLLVFLVYKILILSNTSDLNIEVTRNNILTNDYITELVSSEIRNKNYLTISTREISLYLLAKNPIFKQIIFRRYLFPKQKILVIVKEKNIWGKIKSLTDKVNTKDIYVTDEGDLVFLERTHIMQEPQNIVLISTYDSNLPSKELCIALGNIHKFLITNTNLKPKNFLIGMNSILNIETSDGYKIHAGEINDNLYKNVKKLEVLFKEYMLELSGVEYLDLTLDTGVILKKQPVRENMEEEVFQKINHS